MEIPETHKGDSNERIYYDFLLPVQKSKIINDSESKVDNNNNNDNNNSDEDITDTNNNISYLKCLLISDKLSDKFASSISINIGQMNDPYNFNGIAHLTEHMLFMGNILYPNENDYDTYLNNNNGYHNAYTDLEITNYYFECNNTSYDGALSRFSSSFISPLFNINTIEREINAVDSEHGKNKLNDSWRLHQLSRTILGNIIEIDNSSINDDINDNDDKYTHHPYGSFGTGNKATLLESTNIITTTDDIDNKDSIVKEKSDESEVITEFINENVENTNENKVENTVVEIESDENKLKKQKQIEILQQQVIKFYKRYYKVEHMTLVIMGNQTINELKDVTIKYFSNLPTIINKKYNIPKVIPFIIKKDTLPKIIEIIPIKKESQYIELQYILPEQLSLYKYKPLHYFSHIIGHEGPGSLLSLLRNLQYAHELYTDDNSKTTKSFCIFTIHIELTLLGLDNINIIIKIIKYYIKNIIKNDIPKWIYNELKIMGDTQFRFLSKYGAADTVSSISNQIHYYDTIHYLSGPYKIYNYNINIIKNIFNYISNINNLLILISSIQYENKTNKIDPWYGTEYRIIDSNYIINDNEHELYNSLFDDDIVLDKSITDQLKLPEQNDMLPSNFDILLWSEQISINDNNNNNIFTKDNPSLLPPQCIINTDICRLWYKPDTALFNTPKVNIIILLRTSDCSSNIQQSVLSNIYTEYITEICTEFAYAASMAGLHCSFNTSSKYYSGIEIQLSGYNHKVNILLKRICHTINNILPNEIINNKLLFDRIRIKLEEQYISILVAQPYQYGTYIADLCLESGNQYTVHDRIKYIKEVTNNDFQYFALNILKRFELEVLVHGNVTSKDAIDYTNILLDEFKPKPPLYKIMNRVVQLPKGIECIYQLPGFNDDNENSCVINLYQFGILDIKMSSILSLLNQLIREPSFNTLRTEEQLGYIVHSTIKTNGDNIKSLLFLIQSDSYDPIYMNERIELFLITFRNKLIEMSNDEYQSNINSIYDSLLEKNKNLQEESSKHWHVISNRTYRFHKLNEIALYIKNIKKNDVLCIFDKYILNESIYRKKLSIQIFGKNHIIEKLNENNKNNININSKNIIIIKDPQEFVRTNTLYELSKTTNVTIEDYTFLKSQLH